MLSQEGSLFTHSRTVYDIASPTVAASPQLLPPETYDIILNGQRYTVVALQGFKESKYLQELKSEVSRIDPDGWSRSPIQLSVTCGTETTLALLDALFLVLAYQITETQNMNIDELLCFVEMANTYGLSIDYKQVLHTGVNKVNDIDEFFMFINAVSTFYSKLENQGETKDRTAYDIASAAEKVLISVGDNPSNFEKITEALIFSWLLPDGTLTDNIAWKKELMRQFGMELGKDRSLPSSIMGSYVTNITDDLVDVSSVLFAEEFLPIDLAQVHAALDSNEQFQTIYDTFRTKVRQMYQDLSLSIGEKVRIRLARCFGNWLAAAGMPLNVDLEFDKGFVSSYPFLEYNPLSQDFFYSVATGQVEQTTGLPVFFSQTILDFEKLVQKANKVMVTLAPEYLKKHGLNPNNQTVCSDPSTLVKVGYPFTGIGNVIPSSQFNQFGQCVVSTNLKTIADRAIRDPKVTEAVEFLVC